MHHQAACGASYNMRTEAHLHVPMLLHRRFSFVFYTLKVANPGHSMVAIPLKTARIKECENAPLGCISNSTISSECLSALPSKDSDIKAPLAKFHAWL